MTVWEIVSVSAYINSNYDMSFHWVQKLLSLFVIRELIYIAFPKWTAPVPEYKKTT